MGLVTCLNDIEDFEVVGAVETGEQGIITAKAVNPDLMLINLDLPGLDGIETTRQLKNPDSGIKIIVTCAREDEKRVFAAMQAGADGFCLKEITPERLKEAIYAVLSGGAWLDPPVARKLFSIFSPDRIISPRIVDALVPESKGRKKPAYNLNDREQQILTMMSAGKNNSEIAKNLFVSYHTVKADVTNILKKLGVEDRLHAVIKVLNENLV